MHYARKIVWSVPRLTERFNVLLAARTAIATTHRRPTVPVWWTTKKMHQCRSIAAIETVLPVMKRVVQIALYSTTDS